MNNKAIIISFLFLTACMQTHSEDQYSNQRKMMVKEQIEDRGIKNPQVLKAMMEVPREKFVPNEYRNYSYQDGPLPIGYGQTISQPYIVAYMTEALHLDSNDKVLEIGTGSGYHAAVMSKIAKEVYTIEIVTPLAVRTKKLIAEMGLKNIFIKIGDGYLGWPKHAPFDAIILTAAPPKSVPAPLIEQLKDGGRLIAPVGQYEQYLILYTKEGKKLKKERLLPVRFVPMTGKSQDEK